MRKSHDRDITQALALWRDYCRQKQMRYTPEREAIIREICGSDRHFTVEDLIARIRTRYPKAKIAKTSVYRSLPFFLDCGLLRESITGTGCVIYEHALGHRDHGHLRCIRCGKITEFYSPSLLAAQQRVCRREKFKAVRRINVVHGYCCNCRKKV